MKRLLYLFVLISCIAVTAGFTSCSGDSVDVDDVNKQTLIVFMPWSGSQSNKGLYSIFLENLDSIESAIKAKGSITGRVFVFLSKSAETSQLYEITYESKEIKHTVIKEYSGNIYTTADGITQILNDIKSDGQALNYAMIIGCHGSGWTYKEDWEDYPNKAKANSWTSTMSMAKRHTATNTSYPMTRFYGSVSNNNYATNIPTLAQGIEGAGIKMQYILFDDCYMANVETAYELKNVTNFIVASTSEVIDIGMPYRAMWQYLNSQTPDYAAMVNTFHTFYSNYAYPYGTIAAIDCRKLDKLAEQMKMINANYTLDESLRDSIQALDGFDTTLFYDMGDYVAKLCTNNDILNDFNATLNQVVKASATTDKIYSYLYYPNPPRYIDVKHFSGITISDPSLFSVAVKGKEKTAWWQATH